MRDAMWQPGMENREELIRAAADDPFRCGYEPDIWMVVKALLRGAKPNVYELDHVAFEMGARWQPGMPERDWARISAQAWEVWAAKTRMALGFGHAVGEILVLGANRSGKTDFAARLSDETAMEPKKEINVGFVSLSSGKDIQEPRIWHYLPKELKTTTKTRNDYISYSRHNGFAGSRIVFGNESVMRFITYEMKVDSALEGSAVDLVWLDEEFPKSFLDAARSRISSKRGVLLCTFTPVSGYTTVVADYLDGMLVTKWRTAYMLPRDGKEPLPWRELGLARDEWEALIAWRDAGGTEDPGIPEARPERCLGWWRGKQEAKSEKEKAGSGYADQTDGGTDAELAGRAFARVPRVAICKGGAAAAVWFYGSDNPYGIPGEVIANALKNRNASREVKRRVYGIAEQIKGRMFANFSRERNVVKAADIPRRLVRIMVVDPAPERNWQIGWYGYDPVADVVYKYREWPGNYETPWGGGGVPGPWAEVCDRNGGMNDGQRGAGQDNFGMSLLANKFEWARLEGWRDYLLWAAANDPMTPPDGEDVDAWDAIAGWSDGNGTRERMWMRIIDPRAAAQSKISMRANVSLLEDVQALAEGFEVGSGQKIVEGVSLLQDRLASGRYRISDACVNTIFSYMTYCGHDGQKGACKDPIDCDRYGILSGFTGCGADAAADVADGLPAAPEVAGGGRTRERDGKRVIRAGGI